jgi:benzoate-CoA ligase family protein
MTGSGGGSEPFNLTTHFLDRNLDEGRGERVALYCGEAEVTYAELCSLANRAGHVLRGLGVRKGERVLLALSDSPEFVACWFGALKIGAVVAEAYTFLPVKDYRYYAQYTQARVVVVDATTLAPMREAIAGLPDPPRLLVSGEAELASGETAFAAAAAGASGDLEPAPTSRDDLALWKFTTGSTGSPKAAVHRAYDPVVSFESYAKGVLGYEETDRVLPVPKLFFGYARDLTALFTFGVGAAGIAFPERTTPERIFELIARRRPTILVNVPTMMAQMLAHPGDAGRADLSCLRCVVSSGEALPAEVHRRFVERFGVEVLEGIGSSELYHIYVSNRPGRVRVGSAGQLVPGYEARILDQEGAEVRDGTPGELHVRGASAALRYEGDEERSARTFAGGWVRTGDLFERDADSYLWYRGRADDLLKVGGIWVAPLEIESCLLAHPDVGECAVVGYEEDGLVLPRAYVVTEASRDPEELTRELIEHVRSELSPHKAPRDVRYLDALPKTANGKVDRKALAEGQRVS